MHDLALRLPAGLLPRGGRRRRVCAASIGWISDPQIAVWVESADRTHVRRHADGDQHDRGARHRESPRGLELPVGPAVPVRQAIDGAADLGARARQALRHRRHAGRPARPGSGFHESLSSGEPYYCRPLRAQEINVDAITCPTRFTSAKGKLDSSTTSYYPPRNDLTTFSNGDCDVLGGVYPGCAASATELRGAERSRRGRGGDAALRRAVHGHLDNPDDASRRRLRAARRGEQGIRQQRRAHATRRTTDPQLSGYGLTQQLRPAVGGLPRADSHRRGRRRGAPRRPRPRSPDTATGPGMSGAINGRDATISTADPGSGEGAPARDLDRRRHRPGARPGAALRIDDGMHAAAARARHRVRGRGRQGRAHRHVGRRHLQERGVRRRWRRRQLRDSLPRGRLHDRSGVRGSDPRAPGRARRAWLDRDADPHRAQARDRLRGRGARGRTRAGRPSLLAQVGFATPATPFKQVEGCFVATAAWGSALASQVEALRRARDHARAGERHGRGRGRPLLPFGPPGRRGPAPQRHRPRRGPNVTFCRSPARRRVLF